MALSHSPCRTAATNSRRRASRAALQRHVQLLPQRSCRRDQVAVPPPLLLLLLLAIVSVPTLATSTVPGVLKCQTLRTLVTLECPNTSGRVVWKRGDRPNGEWLRNEGRVLLRADATYIFSTQLEDTGVYEGWTAATPRRQICRMYLVIARARHCKHQLNLAGARTHVAQSGTRVCLNYTFTVSIAGNPGMQDLPVAAKFFHSKTTLRVRSGLDSRHATGQSSGGVSQLCLNNASVHDSGRYKTYASLGSHLGVASITTKLKIREAARFLAEPLLPPVSPPPGGEKSLLNLTCTARGNPLPTIGWYKDGELLVQHKRSRSGDSATVAVRAGVQSKWSVQRKAYSVSSTLNLEEPLASGSYACRIRNVGRYGGEQTSKSVYIAQPRRRHFATHQQ